MIIQNIGSTVLAKSLNSGDRSFKELQILSKNSPSVSSWSWFSSLTTVDYPLMVSFDLVGLNTIYPLQLLLFNIDVHLKFTDSLVIITFGFRQLKTFVNISFSRDLSMSLATVAMVNT